MKITFTRPSCTQPHKFFSDGQTESQLQTAKFKSCHSCVMELILDGRYLPGNRSILNKII